MGRSVKTIEIGKIGVFERSICLERFDWFARGMRAALPSPHAGSVEAGMRRNSAPIKYFKTIIFFVAIPPFGKNAS